MAGDNWWCFGWEAGTAAFAQRLCPQTAPWRLDNAGPYNKGPSDMQKRVRGLNVLGRVCDSAAIAAPWAYKPCLVQGPASTLHVANEQLVYEQP